MIQAEFEKYIRAIEALKIIKDHNRLKNDIDAYLHEVALWGLGLREEMPNMEDYQ
ncbi:MAG: hypothetical protein KAR20_29235 [Candidatus Heimdallarchaeota archaeon]|nr:hypothetical protein [Candidatus Heimdallarchaeota archaeon]